MIGGGCGFAKESRFASSEASGDEQAANHLTALPNVCKVLAFVVGFIIVRGPFEKQNGNL